MEFKWLNDKHLEDIDAVENGSLPSSLAGCGYEKQFRVKSESQLKSILGDSNLIKNLRNKIKTLSFGADSCTFHFYDDFSEDLSFALWKKTIDFQADIFQEITLTFIPGRLSEFSKILEYAAGKGKTLVIFADLNYDSTVLEEVAQLVKDNEGTSTLKLKYKKLDSDAVLDKFIVIKEVLKDSGKSIHVSFANEKSNIKGYKNVSAEFLLKLLGVDSCCTDFIERVGGKGFATTTKVFNRSTLEYDGVAHNVAGDYRKERLGNVSKVNDELAVMVGVMNDSSKLKAYFTSKPAFRKTIKSLPGLRGQYSASL